MGKWVNGFRLKPYYGPLPLNPFEKTKADIELDTGEHEKTITGQAIGESEPGKGITIRRKVHLGRTQINKILSKNKFNYP